MILQDLIVGARQRVSHVQTDDVMRDLRILAAYAMGIEPSRITLHMQDEISEDVRAQFNLYVDARMVNTPISKIIQKRQFWGREFGVDLNVLDPRGDTETLIAACLEIGAPSRVLDLGTGSGAIGLTLAAEWPRAEVCCTDISEEALEVARITMNQLGVADAVTLFQSDWFAQVKGRYDLIVSNPPYITKADWYELDIEVRGFDPRIALTDEGDGLAAYRIITKNAGAFLHSEGHLVVEIGASQKDAVVALFEEAEFTQIQCLPDMAGRDRVVKAVWIDKT